MVSRPIALAKRAAIAPETRFNADRTRFCLPTLEGLACYRGSRDQLGRWRGRLEGIAASEADADRYLEGQLVTLLPARTMRHRNDPS